jgi:hypothetical protein
MDLGIPPHFLIPIIGIIAGTTMSVVLLYPVVRALARRLEGRESAPASVPPDLSDRLGRIEAAVESISIEVERISESQRFLTKLQAGKPGTGSDIERR